MLKTTLQWTRINPWALGFEQWYIICLIMKMRDRSTVSGFFNKTTLCTRVTEKYFLLITGILIEHEKITLDGVYFYARLGFCSARRYPVFAVKRLLLVSLRKPISYFLISRRFLSVLDILSKEHLYLFYYQWNHWYSNNKKYVKNSLHRNLWFKDLLNLLCSFIFC